MELPTHAEIVRWSPPERIALIPALRQSGRGTTSHDDGAERELESRPASFDQDRQNGVTWTALNLNSEVETSQAA